ncbi:MAG: hypothetical protein IJ215_05120 [Clostridia bacterium]|nr:hypothetical protein [Clostridia bacterium]
MRETMENNETNVQSVELQRQVQKLEKLEKMINPNSKKSLILWEEDDAFKNLISDLKEYALTCDVTEFPVELLDKLKALQLDAVNQIVLGATRVVELREQAKKNLELSRTLSSIYISAMAANPLDEYTEELSTEELSPMKEYLETICHGVPDSEEYVKAEKTIKSKISNLENSVHITIDLERTTSKASALEYIKAEITPAIDRLQAEYDAKYTIVEQVEDVETSLALRKTFKDKLYDAFVKPFTSLFKKKTKVKN